MTLDFIVAVRHHESVADWEPVKQAIAQTAASIASQTDPNWRAVLVANVDTPLPELPDKMRVHRVEIDRVDLPKKEDSLEDYFQAIREDKGRRIFAGLESLGSTGHVMVVDYDDFVSGRIAAFVSNHLNEPGWVMNSGYFIEFPGRWALLKRRGFNNSCGSSLIIHSRHLRELLGPSSSVSLAEAARWLGSHKFVQGDLAERGVYLKPFPFPGAAWRLAGPGETSGSRTVLRDVLRGTKNPLRIIVRLFSLRWIGAKFRAEFL